MADKMKTIILLLAISSMICKEKDKDKDKGHEICINSKDETISFAGVVHYEVTNLFPLEGKAESEQEEEVTLVLWDIYSMTFFDFETEVRKGYKAEGGFYVPESPESETNDQIEKYNRILENMFKRLNKTKELPVLTLPLSVKFYFQYNEILKEWQKMVSLNIEERKLDGSMIDVDIWPNEWAKQTPDLGVGAYWKTKQTFVYIINGAEYKNAFVFTRTLDDIENQKNWAVNEIPNTAGKVFTSAFNWLLKEIILTQVIDKGMPRSSAQIYEYIPNDPKLFVFKHKSSRDLWECKEKVTETNEMLVFALMVITIFVLTITVAFVFYFIYFIIIREKKDPLFGIARQRRSRNRNLK